MVETIWASVKPHWQERSACRGADRESFFPPVESDEVLEKIRRDYCNLCPVTRQCLNSAMAHRDTGIWAGTTSAHRRAMRRTRSRSKCPVCEGMTLVAVIHPGDVVYEVCVGCGASWRAEDRPAVRSTARRGPRTSSGVTDVPLPEEAAAS